ncbi:hypothetical protein PM082_024015 [Marasmius tenuissimus]|nr:hypothetical protein PM082_024015 [Marasmius tenuissimus]
MPDVARHGSLGILAILYNLEACSSVRVRVNEGSCGPLNLESPEDSKKRYGRSLMCGMVVPRLDVQSFELLFRFFNYDCFQAQELYRIPLILRNNHYIFLGAPLFSYQISFRLNTFHYVPCGRFAEW